MTDVVVHGGQTNRVSVSHSDQMVVGRIVFNPIRITMPQRTVQIPSGAHVVTSERTVKELDTARMISGETPTPAANGVAQVFTTAHPYVAGSLHVTRGSLRMYPTADYTETSPSAGTFTMVIAPETVEPIMVDYVKA